MQPDPNSPRRFCCGFVRCLGAVAIVCELMAGEPGAPRYVETSNEASHQCVGAKRLVQTQHVARFKEPTAMTVAVREFHFQGNRIFSSDELARLLAPFTQRPITSAELEEARRMLTRHYLAHGYINSGAILPDQAVEDGRITFQIVEGRLAEIVITGTQRLQPGFLRRRISAHVGEPLRLSRLQDALWLVNEDPNIRSIDARLIPSRYDGEAQLELDVRERNPWRVSLQARNDRPPSIGAELVELLVAHQNLIGRSDALQVRLGVIQAGEEFVDFSGAGNFGAAYQLPLTPSGGQIFGGFDKTDYAVVEEPFHKLEIESESHSIRAGWRQSLYRTPMRELAAILTAERRQSESTLGGIPFSFSPGAEDGSAVSTALRFAQEWTDRSTTQLFALRSTFSCGVDLFGSTDDGTDRDGQFLSWLGQAQWIRRLGNTQNQLMLGTRLQVAEGPLLAPEQLALGGAHSVRGYRENQLIRDAGLVATAEFHLPIWIGKNGAPMLQLAPFVDYGTGWNHDQRDAEHLASIGIGILFQSRNRVSGEIYWGTPLTKRHREGNDLQDYGIHFRLGIRAF